MENSCQDGLHKEVIVRQGALLELKDGRSNCTWLKQVDGQAARHGAATGLGRAALD